MKSRRPATAAKTAAKPGAKRVAKPQVKPAAKRVSKPFAKSAPKPAPKPVKRPARAPRPPTDRERIEQLSAEVAVINAVQRALAGERSIQSVYDAVGDKLREVFATGNLAVIWLDATAGLMHFLYGVEHGKRLRLPPAEIAVYLTGRRYHRTLLARKPVLWRNQREYRDWELFVAKGTDMSRQACSQPIFAGDRLVGSVSIENHDTDNAYGDAEVRLLTTVTASMGVALENARLFDETQRLLKETEQRNAELGVINSIQHGMAEKLEFQAIVDLVGGKLAEVFGTGDISIRWHDAETDSIRYLYESEHGVRMTLPPRPTRESPMWQLLARTKTAIVRNTPDELEGLGLQTMPGTDTSLSRARGADLRRRAHARLHHPEQPRARVRVRPRGGATALDRRREHGRRAGERASVRRDAAAAQGD